MGHKGTPIGQGDSIGLMGAVVQMDESWMQDLPEDFRSGLFAHPEGGRCEKWAAALRVSHTFAAERDWTRISLKIKMDTEVVHLLFVETMKSFPIANKESLKAFVHMEMHGL